MACDDFNPCSQCNDCEAEVAPCVTPEYVDTGCPITLPFGCIEYTGNGKPCLGLATGDTGNDIIDKIADAVCDYVTGDKYAKVSATDSTPGYLQTKLLSGVYTSIAKNSVSQVETLTFDVNVTALLPAIIGSNSNTFLNLFDTPDSYVGNQLKMVRVNSSNGLEFSTDYVDRTTAQTINGAKTFTTTVTVTAGGVDVSGLSYFRGSVMLHGSSPIMYIGGPNGVSSNGVAPAIYIYSTDGGIGKYFSITGDNAGQFKVTTGGNTVQNALTMDHTLATFRARINAGNDIEVTNSDAGIVLNSPDGTRARITLNNDLTLTITSL